MIYYFDDFVRKMLVRVSETKILVIAEIIIKRPSFIRNFKKHFHS